MPQFHRSRFVGREPELALLRAELGAALRGEGQLVVLLGEPGIGKTRTATTLAADASSLGASVVWGRCHEDGAAPAYWPWAQALAAYATEHEGEAAERASRVLPLLREGTEAPDEAEVPARVRFALFEAVATTLSAAARGRPLLLVLDDLHWADVGSLLLLRFVAREIAATSLLVLATLRDLELSQRPEIGPLVQEVLRHGRSVPLAGLARPAVQHLLADRIGFAPSDAVVDRVLAASEGNPFFVIEMAQLLAAPGRGGVPAGAAALLRRRLAPLPPASRQLLEAASVLGREFDLDTLAAVRGTTPEAILDALDAPVTLGLVRGVPERPRCHAFTHALLRDCLYEALGPSARARLHAAAARALEGASSTADDRLPLLAHHFLAAAEGGGDPSAAIRYACEAGERALRLVAFEEAVSHFERALGVLAVADDASARLRALVGLGSALHGAGEQPRAEEALREAILLARRMDASTFAGTVLRCAAVRAEISVLDVATNDLLEEALAALPPAASALRARLLARLADGLRLAPGSELRRRTLADEATAMARELGDPATLAFVLSRRLTALLGPDNLDERLETIAEIARGGSGLRELDMLVFRIGDLAELGDRAGLDHALVLFAQRMRASREPFFRWSLATFRAALALLEGRYEEAEAFAGEALAIGRQVQKQTAMLNYAQQLFLLRGEQGRFAEVEPLVVAGASETAVVPAWRCGLADFYSAAGRTAEARREFEALASDAFASLPRDSTWLTAMVLLASACCRLRDRERAATLLDESTAIARSLGMTLLLSWLEETRAAATPPGTGEVSAPPRGQRRPGRQATFRREGDVWTLAFDGRTTRVRHMVGLAHLARLLAQPSHEVHVVDLVDAVQERTRNGGRARAAIGDSGELLDARARADYVARLRAAREELDEAAAANDYARSERLEEEADFLEGELARGYGLGGRTRRAGSAPERARVAVTRAIKYAIDRVGEQDPGLAEHLRLAVRTGLFCAYEPPSRDCVVWSL